jgi:hypothetical protein
MCESRGWERGEVGREDRNDYRFKDGRGDDGTAELDRKSHSLHCDWYSVIPRSLIHGDDQLGRRAQDAEEDNRTVPDLNRLYTRDGPILGEEEVRQAKNPVESFVCHDAEESEEEMIVPEPCSFTAGRHFLGMS